MRYSQDQLSFQLDYHHQVEVWLEKSYMERYPFHSILLILHYVNMMWDALVLSIFNDLVNQLWFLFFDACILVGLELHVWLH